MSEAEPTASRSPFFSGIRSILHAITRAPSRQDRSSTSCLPRSSAGAGRSPSPCRPQLLKAAPRLRTIERVPRLARACSGIPGGGPDELRLEHFKFSPLFVYSASFRDQRPPASLARSLSASEPLDFLACGFAMLVAFALGSRPLLRFFVCFAHLRVGRSCAAEELQRVRCSCEAEGAGLQL